MRQDWNGSPGGRGRLLLVAPSAYPLGGVATWLDDIVPGLRDRGWDVTLGLTAGRRHDVDAYLARHPMADVERIDCNSATLESRRRSLMRIIRKHDPDIVTSVNIPDVYLAITLLREQHLCKTRVAMALHALEDDYFLDIKRNVKLLDGVIATNRLALKLAEKYSGLERERGFYAPCGVETLDRMQSADSGGALRIAFAGRLAFDQKRVGDIPPIAAGLARRGVPCQWLIAGAGPQENWLRQELQDGVDKGAVRFFGDLSPEDLSRRVYREADVLLITSSWETGPIVAWEAMAHGVVVASSNYIGAGAENSLRHLENCLLFETGDADQAVEQLMKLRDAGLRERLAREALALVAERYSREASIDAWSRAFAEILRLPPRPPLPPARAPRASGRLDRLLGVSMGESVRELIGRRSPGIGAGGEWPHSHSSASADNARFLALAAQLDRPSSASVERGVR